MNGDDSQTLFDFRQQYPHLKPYAYVTVAGRPMIYEVMSWPWISITNAVEIYIREPDDPTTLEAVNALDLTEWKEDS